MLQRSSYGTSSGDLAVQGAICGLGVGVAQATVLRDRLGAVAFLWAPALAAIWALGWTVTAGIGVDVERQYTVFGSSGALVVTLATTALPWMLARAADRSGVVSRDDRRQPGRTGGVGSRCRCSA